MIAVVTGCAGFIGSHLSEKLLAQGHDVRGVDNFLPSYDIGTRRRRVSRMNQRARFQFRQVDLGTADLSELIDGADVVFHLAARPGVRTSWGGFDSYLTANLLASQRLFDAVAQAGSARVVYASSSSVYGKSTSFPTRESDALCPISPYGVTKVATENLAEAYESEFGLDAVGLRFFTVYGPRQRPDMAFHLWIRAAMSGGPITVFGDGSAVRDYTYVDDVVDAVIAASGVATPSIMNVAGGTPVSVSHVLDLIAENVGVDLDVVHVEVPPGDPPRTAGDTQLIREVCGWEPMHEFEVGLKAQVDWMSRQL